MSQTTRIVEDHPKLECPRNLTAEQRRFADIGGWRTFLSFLIGAQSVLKTSCRIPVSVSTVTYLCAMLEYIDALFWEHRLSSVEQTKDDNRIRRLAIGFDA
jgi:hypothetical protein